MYIWMVDVDQLLKQLACPYLYFILVTPLAHPPLLCSPGYGNIVMEVCGGIIWFYCNRRLLLLLLLLLLRLGFSLLPAGHSWFLLHMLLQVVRKNVPAICGPNGSFNPHLRVVSNFFRPDDTLTIVGMFNMVSIYLSGGEQALCVCIRGPREEHLPFFLSVLLLLLLLLCILRLLPNLFPRWLACRFPLSMILTRMGPLFQPFFKLVCVFFVALRKKKVVVLLPQLSFSQRAVIGQSKRNGFLIHLPFSCLISSCRHKCLQATEQYTSSGNKTTPLSFRCCFKNCILNMKLLPLTSLPLTVTLTITLTLTLKPKTQKP